MRTFALVLALLMSLAMDGLLLAEVVPEVLIEERKEKSSLDDDIKQLKKEAEEAKNLQNYSQAIDLYERILILENERIIRDDKSGKNKKWGQHPARFTLINLARLYKRQGIYYKAETLYLRLLSIDEKAIGPENPNTASTIMELANVYKDQGQYSEAEPLYLRALSIKEKTLGPEHYGTGTALDNLASLYAIQGKYNKAEPLFLRALSIAEKNFGPEHAKTTFTLNNLALFYYYQGKYNKAEPLFLRALSIKEKEFGPQHLHVGLFLVNLANLYKTKGDYSKAEPLYVRALSIVEKDLGTHHPYIAKLVISLANLYSDQGLYSKGEPLHSRAISISEKILGPDHPDTAYSIDNLANSYQNQGLYSKAEPLYLKAISIFEKALGPDHPDLATSLNGLALSYQNQGLYSKAEPLYLRAISIFEKALGPDHPDTAVCINNLANSYQNQGLYSKAESLYLRALSILESSTLGPQNIYIDRLLINLALNYSSQGLYEKAIPLMFRAQKGRISLIQRESPYLTLTDREAFVAKFKSSYLRSFDFVSRGHSGIELALYVRLNRHGLLEEIEGRQAKLAKLEGPQKRIASELKRVIQKLASSVLKDKERGELIKRKENLEKKLYRILPKLKPRLVTLKQVARSIPKDGILIEFQRYTAFDSANSKKEEGKKHYLALILNPNGKKSAINLGTADLIDRKIIQALQASEEGLADAQQLWKEVGELVIKPLKESIGDAQILFISPDAELNRIPFATLSSHKDNQLLGDAGKIRLLTSGRELLDLVKRSKSIKQKPLVVANPAFNLLKPFTRKQESELIAISQSQQRSGDLTSINWSPLPGTAKEGKAIAKLTNAQLLTKNKASALAIQEQQQAPKVLHIASHAYFLADRKKGENPLLRSGIVLAGANEPEANPKDDGYLTALEVTKLDWNGTELVVISGCESGKGDIQSGEGVYGLKRAIAVAGARSSLLSLWEVDDAATAAFMKSFYERLKKGEGRAEALAATQKEFRNHSVPGWRHPYVWAAFQLSGDWRSIDW